MLTMARWPPIRAVVWLVVAAGGCGDELIRWRDPDVVAEEAASSEALEILANEHTEAVTRWDVFGVPTYIEDEEAVFVRFMERGRVDDLEQVLGMLQWTRLNEFKRTRIER